MTNILWLLQRVARAINGDRSAALRELDARMLADIGVHASEIDSIEAEWLGRSELTRLRIAGNMPHA